MQLATEIVNNTRVIKAEIVINVRFLTTAEGGRQKPIIGAQMYGCPFFINGEGFDCRLFLHGQTIELGKYYEIPVKFLSPELALPKVAVGKEIFLREFKCTAKGWVKTICDAKAQQQPECQ